MNGKRVPLTHIAIHGNANFVAHPFHDVDFSTGDRNAAATADSEIPKSCSLAWATTGLFSFDKAHAVVDLIEDATITSCKGWQRPDRVLFKQNHRSEVFCVSAVGRVLGLNRCAAFNRASGAGAKAAEVRMPSFLVSPHFSTAGSTELCYLVS